MQCSAMQCNSTLLSRKREICVQRSYIIKNYIKYNRDQKIKHLNSLPTNVILIMVVASHWNVYIYDYIESDLKKCPRDLSLVWLSTINLYLGRNPTVPGEAIPHAGMTSCKMHGPKHSACCCVHLHVAPSPPTVHEAARRTSGRSRSDRRGVERHTACQYQPLRTDTSASSARININKTQIKS